MWPSGVELKSKSSWSRISLLLILFPPSLFGASTFLVQAPSGPPQRDLDQVKQLEEEYLRAEVEDDASIAGAILADDYVGLKGDGTTSTKSDVLARLGRHERRRQPYMVTASGMREYLFGDTICVSYLKVYSKPGSEAVYRENVLHLLVKRNGI